MAQFWSNELAASQHAHTLAPRNDPRGTLALDTSIPSPFGGRDIDINAGGNSFGMNSTGLYQALIPDEGAYRTSIHERHTIERIRQITIDGQQSSSLVDPQVQRTYIKRLFDAMKATTNVIDKPCKNGKPAQAVQRIQNGFYPDKAIEIACWNIFISCRDSQLGVRMVDPHHGTRKETNDVYPSFEDRINMIIHGCTISKAMCKSILDPPYISRLVDAPGSEIQMKQNNKKINTERDIQNEIGRKAVNRGLKVEDILSLQSSQPEKYINPQLASSVSSITPDSGRSLISIPVGTASSLHTPSYSTKSGKRKEGVRSLITKNEENNDVQYQELKPDPLLRRPRRRHPPTVTSATAHVAASNDVEMRESPDFPTQPDFRWPSSHLSAPSPTTTHLPTSSIVSEPTPNDVATAFREIICDILQVDRSWATQYNLHDLRVYARAYNRSYVYDEWHHPDIPFYSGRQYHLLATNTIIPHFAQALPSFAPLAVARGDLTPDRLWNQDSPHNTGFDTEGDVSKDRALGVAENPCGFHNQLHNTHQPRREF